MGKEESLEYLRRAVYLLAALNERSFSELQKLFTFRLLQRNEFFLRTGEYPLSLAFIDTGVVKSYYSDQQGREIIRGIFVPGMFAMPLPAFIYRKPSFLNFRAVTPVTLLLAKFSDIQALANSDHSIRSFIRLLIDREWIINHELHDAGLYVYNHQTRYALFRARYESYISQIPDELIASFLNIPLKQLERFTHQKEM